MRALSKATTSIVNEIGTGIMKRHLSSLVFGLLGCIVGFTTCFIYGVLPARQEAKRAPVFAPVMVKAQPELRWEPHLIHPTIPPKIVR
jgi:hypothetical protein